MKIQIGYKSVKEIVWCQTVRNREIVLRNECLNSGKMCNWLIEICYLSDMKINWLVKKLKNYLLMKDCFWLRHCRRKTTNSVRAILKCTLIKSIINKCNIIMNHLRERHVKPSQLKLSGLNIMAWKVNGVAPTSIRIFTLPTKYW